MGDRESLYSSSLAFSSPCAVTPRTDQSTPFARGQSWLRRQSSKAPRKDILVHVGEICALAEALAALGPATGTNEFATPWQLLAALPDRRKNRRRAGTEELGAAT